MTIKFRRRSPMQDAFDGLSERDAARLRALLGKSHSESNSPRAGDMMPVTESGNKRGRRA